jgi:hypothetical protein
MLLLCLYTPDNIAAFRTPAGAAERRRSRRLYMAKSLFPLQRPTVEQ